MSDPNHPPSMFITTAQRSLSRYPDAYTLQSEDQKVKLKALKKVESVTDYLKQFATGMAHAVVLDPKLLASEKMRMGGGDFLLRAAPEMGKPRIRSAQGKEFACRAYDVYPSEGSLGSVQDIEAVGKAAIRVLAPGPNMTTGRLSKYFPRKGRTAAVPDTSSKVRVMLKLLGMDISRHPASVRSPFPLVQLNGGPGVKVAAHSSNGLPTLGNSDDAEDMERCLGLARSEEMLLQAAYAASGKEGVRAHVRQGQQERPHMWTLLGRAKGEVTTIHKYDDLELRFYTTWPRWLLLLQQRVTQVFEQLCDDVLSNPMCHNAQGISLAHGGAARLAEALDLQLETDGVAWVVCGDDSLVVWWDGKRLHLFALDGSSFDLTQLFETLSPYQHALCEQMLTISPMHAFLWLYSNTFRKVNMLSSVVRTMKDTNPSGGTLVSKLNSLSMGSGVKEVTDGLQADLLEGALTAPVAEEEIAERIKSMAERRGWTVKLEQYRSTTAETFTDALREAPFLFLGYWLHRDAAETDIVQCCLDPHRWMASCTTPSGMHAKGEEFTVLEAMRLGGLALNFGVPPVAYQPAFDAARLYALGLLAQIRSESKYAVFLDKDMGAWDESPTVGIPSPNDVAGLYGALLTSPFNLWSTALTRSVPMPPAGDGKWGDAEIEEEVYQEAVAGVDRPLPGPPPKPVVSKKRVVTNKPPVEASDGRPPPLTKLREPKSKSLPTLARPTRSAHPQAQAYSSDLEESEGENDVFYDVSDAEDSDPDREPSWQEVGEDAQADTFNRGVIQARRGGPVVNAPAARGYFDKIR